MKTNSKQITLTNVVVGLAALALLTTGVSVFPFPMMFILGGPAALLGLLMAATVALSIHDRGGTTPKTLVKVGGAVLVLAGGGLLVFGMLQNALNTHSTLLAEFRRYQRNDDSWPAIAVCIVAPFLITSGIHLRANLSRAEAYLVWFYWLLYVPLVSLGVHLAARMGFALSA